MSRPLSRRLGWNWWITRPSYFLVLLREVTAVFMLVELVLLLILLHKAGQSEAVHRAYLDFLLNPGMVVLHAISAAAALWHTITWFNLTPKALVIRIGTYRVPGFFLIAPQWGAFALITGLIILWVWWVGAL